MKEGHECVFVHVCGERQPVNKQNLSSEHWNDSNGKNAVKYT